MLQCNIVIRTKYFATLLFQPAGRLLGLSQLPQDQPGDPPVGDGDHHLHIHVRYHDHTGHCGQDQDLRIIFYITMVMLSMQCHSLVIQEYKKEEAVYRSTQGVFLLRKGVFLAAKTLKLYFPVFTHSYYGILWG